MSVGENFEIDIGRRAPLNSVRLVIFPFAGGSASSFYRWIKDFPFKNEVSISIIELPGRGKNSRHPLICDFNELNSWLLNYLVALTEETPCIFLGYSMGALIAYEQARLLSIEKGISLPMVILAARNAPIYREPISSVKKFTRKEMIENLRKLGGTPEKILDEPELFSHYYDVLDADFQVLNSCVIPKNSNINSPITVIAGVDDTETNIQQLYDWKSFTRSSFNFHLLQGKHFFLYSSHDAMINLIATYIKKFLNI